MTAAQSLLAFGLAAALLTITPGLDTALVLRSALVEGRRAAVGAALGITAGVLCWGSLAAVGIGAVLAASPRAFAALKWAGAAYLVVLGARMLIQPRRSLGASGPRGAEAARGSFGRGLATNLLNPKVGVFYVSFLPQFVPDGVPAAPFMMLLAAVHAALGLGWLCLLGTSAGALRGVVGRPAVMRGLDRLTGGVFIGFGLRLALSPRA